MTKIHAHANGGTYGPAQGETDEEFASRVQGHYGVDTCRIDHTQRREFTIQGVTFPYEVHGA